MVMYRTNVKVAKGSSGSGIFNQRGELVGIVSMYDDHGKASFIVPLQHIRLFLYGIEE